MLSFADPFLCPFPFHVQFFILSSSGAEPEELWEVSGGSSLASFLGGLLWACCWTLGNTQEAAFLHRGGEGSSLWRLQEGKVRVEGRTRGEEEVKNHSPSL